MKGENSSNFSSHSVEITEIYSHCFLEKIRESIGFTNKAKLLNSWFDESFFSESVRENWTNVETISRKKTADAQYI